MDNLWFQLQTNIKNYRQVASRFPFLLIDWKNRRHRFFGVFFWHFKRSGQAKNHSRFSDLQRRFRFYVVMTIFGVIMQQARGSVMLRDLHLVNFTCEMEVLRLFLLALSVHMINHSPYSFTQGPVIVVRVRRFITGTSCTLGFIKWMYSTNKQRMK